MIAEIPLRGAPVDERLRVFRPQPDRLVVIPDGSRAIAEGTFRVAPVVERLRGLRPQPDRLVVIPDGSRAIAEGTFRVAPVVERLRELRPQPDRLVVIPDGSRAIAVGTFRVAVVESCFCASEVPFVLDIADQVIVHCSLPDVVEARQVGQAVPFHVRMGIRMVSNPSTFLPGTCTKTLPWALTRARECGVRAAETRATPGPRASR